MSAEAFGRNAAGSAVQPCPQERHWVEIVLVDADGKPMAGAKYVIHAPGAAPQEGALDAQGRGGYWEIGEGTCRVTFPALEQTGWAKA